MNLVLWLLYIAILWYKKTTSLPKLYFSISSKRGIQVKDLRQIEKFGQKIVKLRLDIKYFEICSNLNLCPEFLKFRPPKLKVYNDSSDWHRVIVLKKFKEIKRDLYKAEKEFCVRKTLIQQLSIIEKSCLLSLLSDTFQQTAKTTIVSAVALQLRAPPQSKRKSPCSQVISL